MDAFLNLAVGSFNGDGAVFVTKVRRPTNVAEETDFEHTGEELDPLEEIGGVLHLRLWERSVDAEVSIVGDDRTSLGLAHSEDRLVGTHLFEILKDLCVGERSDFDRNALQPFCAEMRSVLAVVGDDDELVGSFCENLFPKMASATALDTVQSVVDLVSTVDGDIDAWEAVDIAETKTSVDDELSRLKAGGNEPSLCIDSRTLLCNSLDDIGYCRA